MVKEKGRDVPEVFDDLKMIMLALRLKKKRI